MGIVQKSAHTLSKQTEVIKAFLPEVLGYGLLFGVPLILFIALQRHTYEIQQFFISSEKQAVFVTTIEVKFLDFMTLVFSMLIEAIPFVILGVLVSVIVQVFLPTEKIIRRLPRNI